MTPGEVMRLLAADAEARGGIDALPEFEFDSSFSSDEAWKPEPRRVPWPLFGLTILGCAVGGLALGYLIAATFLDRLLNPR